MIRPTPNYEIYIDGASHGNPGPAGIGVVVLDLSAAPKDRRNPGGAQAGGTDKPVAQFSKYLGETTNNVAEYLALIYALQEAIRHRYVVISVKTDSELLARQISGRYKVRDPKLRLFHDLARSLMRHFRTCQIEHIPREQNTLADRLAGAAVKDHLQKITSKNCNFDSTDFKDGFRR